MLPLFVSHFRYHLQYQEPIPCEQLVSSLCDLKQAYTQFGGNLSFLRSVEKLIRIFDVEFVAYFKHEHYHIYLMCLRIALSFSTGKRPFGVSLLYMGWDKHYGFQLYQSDPSGNYGGWKATCIGNNSAVSLDSRENSMSFIYFFFCTLFFCIQRLFINSVLIYDYHCMYTCRMQSPC